MQLTADDWKRNTTSFVYPSYHYDAELRGNRTLLKSSLTQMDDLKTDCSAIEIHRDYENVGKFGFISA